MKRKSVLPQTKPKSKANAETKLNKRAIRQTLRGYARAEKLNKKEIREWSSHLTDKGAREIVDFLLQEPNAWKKFAHDYDELEQHRLESKVQGRRIFSLLWLKHAMRQTDLVEYKS